MLLLQMSRAVSLYVMSCGHKILMNVQDLSIVISHDANERRFFGLKLTDGLTLENYVRIVF